MMLSSIGKLGGAMAGCVRRRRTRQVVAACTVSIFLWILLVVISPNWLTREKDVLVEDIRIHQFPPAGTTPSQSAGQRVKMRMSLSSTQHRWPWGEDPYFTREWCEKKQYDLSRLSAASVVICFHETEQLEHLLHTVHSIVQNSPQHLLQEIILVDDNSKKEIHRTYLANYVAAVFGARLVRLVHHRGPEQLGVIGCRVQGIRLAEAPVVVVLDAHLEVREKWLEPLLHEIAQDHRTLASVTLDWMKPQTDGTWVYEHGPNDAIIAWYWRQFAFSLWTQESVENSKRLKTDPTQPFLNPCTVGNWAMNRAFFWEIGGLDEGMKLWGGENIDIAIRTYLWGGRVLGVPCSHAAHLEAPSQRSYRQGWGEHISANYKRIVEVWFDEYKETFYQLNPEIKVVYAGNLTERLQVKARCPNKIQTYFDKGYPQLGNTLGRNFARGGLRCVALPHHHMYWADPWTFGMRPEGGSKYQEDVYLTAEGSLRNDVAIFTAGADTKFEAHTIFMLGGGQDTKWMHKKHGMMKVADSEMCLQCGKEVSNMTRCNPADPHQQWIFNDYTHLYQDLVGEKLAAESNFLEIYSQFLRLLKAGVQTTPPRLL